MIRLACQDAPLLPRLLASSNIRTRLGGGLLSIPLNPFPAAQKPGYEHVGQALRFYLSDLVRMKDVPARTSQRDTVEHDLEPVCGRPGRGSGAVDCHLADRQPKRIS